MTSSYNIKRSCLTYDGDGASFGHKLEFGINKPPRNA